VRQKDALFNQFALNFTVARAACASFPDPTSKDRSLKAFIPDPADSDKLDVGTTASGIAADDAGTVYAADVAAYNLWKYVKVK
jgi:hypothetical protein